MTKSEARAIREGCTRALRVTAGVDLLDAGLSADVARQVYTLVKVANDEIQRIADMANAELER